MLARRESRTPSPLFAVALLLAACSVLPEANYPPFHDHHLAADFVVPADGRLRMPSSSRSLTVQELFFEPAPSGEQFGAAGERWLLYPAGTEVRMQGRFRVYASSDGHVPGVAEVLFGARHVQHVEAP